MPTELIIMGAGGLAKEIGQLVRQIDPESSVWHSISYVSETAKDIGKKLPYGDVCRTDEDIIAINRPCDVAIAVGDPHVRQELSAQLALNRNLNFPNIIHPGVEIDRDLVCLGQGNIIAKGVVMTCDVSVGDFNLFNWNVTIGHDSTIGSFNVLNPATNVSGYSHIGDQCLLGTGCQILERLSLTSNTIVGAGAVVTSSIHVSGTYLGVPAKRSK